MTFPRLANGRVLWISGTKTALLVSAGRGTSSVPAISGVTLIPSSLISGTTGTLSASFANGVATAVAATMDGAPLTLSGVTIGAGTSGTVMGDFLVPADGPHTLVLTVTIGGVLVTAAPVVFSSVAAPVQPSGGFGSGQNVMVRGSGTLVSTVPAFAYGPTDTVQIITKIGHTGAVQYREPFVDNNLAWLIYGDNGSYEQSVYVLGNATNVTSNYGLPNGGVISVTLHGGNASFAHSLDGGTSFVVETTQALATPNPTPSGVISSNAPVIYWLKILKNGVLVSAVDFTNAPTNSIAVSDQVSGSWKLTNGAQIKQIVAPVVSNAPIQVYDLYPVNTKIDQISASSFDGNVTYSLTSDFNKRVFIDPTGGGVYIKQPFTGLAGTAMTYTARATDDVGNYTDHTVTSTIGAATVVASSNMTGTPNTLANWVSSPTTPRLAVAPAVTGMGGAATWVITQANTHPYLSDRYIINSATGAVSAVAPLDTPGDDLVLTALCGANVCVNTFHVPVTAAPGPTVWIGQGMAAAHPPVNGVAMGFEHFDAFYAMTQGQGDGAVYVNADVKVVANADPNYYANDNAGYINPRNVNCPSGQSARFGIAYPMTIEGVANGPVPMPRLGGTIGSPLPCIDAGNKGFIVVSSGGVKISRLKITDVHANSYVEGQGPGPSQLTGCAIRYNAGIYGNLTVDSCDLYDNDQGIETGDTTGNVTITNTRIDGSGMAYVGSGATHNVYIGGCYKLVWDNNLSTNSINGHEFKCRAKEAHLTNSRFYDTTRGGASAQAEFPDAGDVTVQNCQFHKGPMPQNGFSIKYGAEQTHDWPVNNLNVTGCTLVNDGVPVNVDHAIYLCGQVGLKLGNVTTGSASNNSFFGWNGNNCKAEFGYYQQFQSDGVTPSFFVVDFSATGGTSPTFTIVETGSTALSAHPALDMSSPISGYTLPRPGPRYWNYDGEHDTHWPYITGVQIDPGLDDIRIPTSTAVGTTVATWTAYGCSYYAMSGVTNDIRVQPFVAGTTWELAQGLGDPYYTYPYTLLSPSQMTIDNSGNMVLRQSLAAGTYYIYPRAHAPNGTIAGGLYLITVH